MTNTELGFHRCSVCSRSLFAPGICRQCREQGLLQEQIRELASTLPYQFFSDGVQRCLACGTEFDGPGEIICPDCREWHAQLGRAGAGEAEVRELAQADAREPWGGDLSPFDDDGKWQEDGDATK